MKFLARHQVVLYLLGIYALGWAIQAVQSASDTDFLYDSDTGATFMLYKSIYLTGHWEPLRDNLLSSSLVTTLFPAYLNRIFPADPQLFFKHFIFSLIALLPVMVFLVSRLFLSNHSAVLAALFVMVQFYFQNGYQTSRVNIALAFFLLGLAAIYYHRRRVTVISLLAGSALMITFSHYGTAFITAGLLLLAGFLGLSESNKKRSFLFLAYGGLIAVFAGVFYSYFQIGALHYARHVITEMANLENLTAGNQGTVSWFLADWARRGNDIGYYAQISWFLFWLSIVLWSGGIILWFKEKRDKLMGYLAIVAAGIVVGATLVPSLEIYYGFIRVYFTAMVIIAPFFILGCQRLAKLYHLPAASFSLPTIILLESVIYG